MQNLPFDNDIQLLVQQTMVVSLEVSHCATNTSIESFMDILSHRPQFFLPNAVSRDSC